jgi:hypothetical protein
MWIKKKNIVNDDTVNGSTGWYKLVGCTTLKDVGNILKKEYEGFHYAYVQDEDDDMYSFIRFTRRGGLESVDVFFSRTEPLVIKLKDMVTKIDVGGMML